MIAKQLIVIFKPYRNTDIIGRINSIPRRKFWGNPNAKGVAHAYLYCI